MNHSFAASKLDPTKCAYNYPLETHNNLKCDRPFSDHTSLAHCESCQKMAECAVYDDKNILMCWECKDKNIAALIDRTNEAAERNRAARELVVKSQSIDSKMEYNGSFYNAETVSISELKTAIESNEEVPADKKAYELQGLILERLEKFSARVFVIDNEKFELQNRINADFHALKQFGQELRDEARNKIKEHDALYKPSAAIKIKLDKKIKDKTRTDNVIEAMMAIGMTREEAMAKVKELQKAKDEKESTQDKMINAYIDLYGGTRENALEQIRKGTQK